MKRKKETKKLKKLIDSKEGENVLNEDAAPYATSKRLKESDEEDNLTEEQMADLDKAFEEMENGEYATMADFKKAMSRWLTE
jgi:hypothetical protein